MRAHTLRLLVVALVPIGLAAGCEEDKKRPLGASCTNDEQCAEGQCLAGLCLDPSGDEDGDGLTNTIEAGLGTDPLDPDSDGDGVRDDVEVGTSGTALDADSDGRPDAIESLVSDSDGDCIVDQQDPHDGTPETDPAELARFVCVARGACGSGGATASCGGADLKVPTCDYSAVAAYEADETACDGVDNDCDGETDEAHKAGGSVTFDGGPLAADAGKTLGDVCGAGACAGGVVQCGSDGLVLACSTASNAGVLTCGADNDCNGVSDESQLVGFGAPIAGCVDYYQDLDDDLHGADEAACLCTPSEGYVVTSSDDCAPRDDTIHPGAAGICGVDADCDEALLDADEACDDGDDASVLDGCEACAVVPRRLASEGDDDIRSIAAAGLVDGGFVLAWDDGYLANESYAGQSLVFFDAQGYEVKRFEDLGSGPTYGGVGVVALRGGDVVMGYWRPDPTNEQYVFEAQRYSSVGEAKGAPVDVAASASAGYIDVKLVATTQGAYALFFVDYTSNDPYKLARVDADDKVAPDEGVLTFLDSANALDVLGFADGSVVIGWTSFDQEAAHTAMYAQRVDDQNKVVGDVIALDAESSNDKRALALAHGPDAGSWGAFFLESQQEGQLQINAGGYVVVDALDVVTGAPKFLSGQDVNGCPYEIVGGFDGAGHAFIGFEDGECGSEVRAWMETESGIAPLALTDPEIQPRTGYLAVVTGQGPAFVHAFDASGKPDGGIYISRFDTHAEPRYVPVVLPSP